MVRDGQQADGSSDRNEQTSAVALAGHSTHEGCARNARNARNARHANRARGPLLQRLGQTDSAMTATPMSYNICMTTHEPTNVDAASASSARPSTASTDNDRLFLISGERLCGWCAKHFPVVRRPGRPKIYCDQSCRQRAYERRRGLAVLPPPDRIVMVPGGPLAHLRPRPGAYELGRISWIAGKLHAMRAAGISDTTGRRLTLCGLLARPSPREFHPSLDGTCLTCARVRAIRPPARPSRPSDDLAALRSLLDVAAIEMSRSHRSQHAVKGPGEIITDLLMAV